MTFEEDGKANVRAAAIAWLATAEGDEYLDTIREASYDNGYRDGVNDCDGQDDWDAGYEQGWSEGYAEAELDAVG
jgi:hypothetical protein